MTIFDKQSQGKCNFATYMNYRCNIDDILNQWSQYWMNNLIFQKDCWSSMVKNSIMVDFLVNRNEASKGWNGDLSLKNTF